MKYKGMIEADVIIHSIGVPIMAQQKRIWLACIRMRVQSLALLSGFRIWHCREQWCRSHMRFWSWVAVAVVEAGSYSSDSTPSLGTSICHRWGPKKTINKQTNKNNSLNNSERYLPCSCPQISPGEETKTQSHYYTSINKVLQEEEDFIWGS